jgi:hypothetical protein
MSQIQIRRPARPRPQTELDLRTPNGRKLPF